jgi:hypothetical protein
MVQRLGEKVEGCCDNLELRIDVVEQHTKEASSRLRWCVLKLKPSAWIWTNTSPVSSWRSAASTASWSARPWRSRKEGRASSTSTTPRRLTRLLPMALISTALNHLTEIVSLGFPSLASRSMVRTNPNLFLMLLSLELMPTVVLRCLSMLSLCPRVMGNCLKSIFRCSVEMIPNSGILAVRTILTCKG